MERDDNAEIYFMIANGSGGTCLIDNIADDEMSIWQPRYSFKPGQATN
jgi:hypothetical protein